MYRGSGDLLGVRDVQGDFVASVHEVLVAVVVRGVDVLAVGEGQVLLGQLVRQLLVTVLLPRRAELGHLGPRQVAEELLYLKTEVDPRLHKFGIGRFYGSVNSSTARSVLSAGKHSCRRYSSSPLHHYNPDFIRWVYP